LLGALSERARVTRGEENLLEVGSDFVACEKLAALTCEGSAWVEGFICLEDEAISGANGLSGKGLEKVEINIVDGIDNSLLY